jgi:hypothetical protein
MSSKPYSFIIYGHPATKKNSATMVKGRSILLPSKTYREYEKVFKQQMWLLKDRPHYDTGVQVTARYYLKDKAHYPDLVGLMQATADLISDEYKVKNRKKTLITEWILTDDRIIKSWDGTCIAGLDKENPRVEVTITPLAININEETDPYLIRLLKEKQEIRLF